MVFGKRASRSLASAPLARFTLLALLAPAAAGAQAGPDGVTTYAYVIDSEGDVLYRHTFAQPGTLEAIAPVSSPTSSLIVGCDSLPQASGLLYCIEGLTQAFLFTVAVADGEVTTIGPSTATAGTVFTTVAADPTTGILYTTATSIFTSDLYTLDPATGNATPVGDITNSQGVTAAAFDPAGQLFVYDVISGGILLAVDKTNAEGTVLGATGFVSANNVSLDFTDDGTCWLWGRNGATGDNELYTCDTTTGAATLVGAVGDVSPGGTLDITAAAAVVDATIFADGFESGDTGAWSSAVP